MSKNIETNKLFVASCLALLVTSLSFGIRAGVLSQQGIDFNLDSAQLGTIACNSFLGIPFSNFSRRYYC
jgi:pilus assembly protein TadC